MRLLFLLMLFCLLMFSSTIGWSQENIANTKVNVFMSQLYNVKNNDDNIATENKYLAMINSSASDDDLLKALLAFEGLLDLNDGKQLAIYRTIISDLTGRYKNNPYLMYRLLHIEAAYYEFDEKNKNPQKAIELENEALRKFQMFKEDMDINEIEIYLQISKEYDEKVLLSKDVNENKINDDKSREYLNKILIYPLSLIDVNNIIKFQRIYNEAAIRIMGLLTPNEIRKMSLYYFAVVKLKEIGDPRVNLLLEKDPGCYKLFNSFIIWLNNSKEIEKNENTKKLIDEMIDYIKVQANE